MAQREYDDYKVGDEIFISRSSHYGTQYHTEVIKKITKSKIVTGLINDRCSETVYTKRKSGTFEEKGSSEWRAQRLEFDKGEVEKELAKRKAVNDRLMHNKELVSRIEAVIKSQRCGDGKFRFSDDHVQEAFESAVKILEEATAK